MTRNKTRACFVAAAFALSCALLAGFTPKVARAQNPSPAPAQTGKVIKTRFEVVSMLYQSLQVRSLSNQRELHTFSYSTAIRPQMQKVQSAGGYKYGDKVTVWYHEGVDVALKIKGKPSKPR
ncbi:MAG TPA: hypothetical protein VNY09_05735 [Candidatus Sulfotelmatobacter sp.]|jgi:hypothetical protein|nr:hypothetical protein [Candidatus Sulfotelmatobacter sp.]